MKIKNYDYKYLLILFLAVIIIGNGCGIFEGVRLYEGASGSRKHKTKKGEEEKKGATSKNGNKVCYLQRLRGQGDYCQRKEGEIKKQQKRGKKR